MRRLRWWLHIGPNPTPRMRYFSKAEIRAALDKLLADIERALS